MVGLSKGKIQVKTSELNSIADIDNYINIVIDMYLKAEQNTKYELIEVYYSRITVNDKDYGSYKFIVNGYENLTEELNKGNVFIAPFGYDTIYLMCDSNIFNTIEELQLYFMLKGIVVTQEESTKPVNIADNKQTILNDSNK